MVYCSFEFNRNRKSINLFNPEMPNVDRECIDIHLIQSTIFDDVKIEIPELHHSSCSSQLKFEICRHHLATANSQSTTNTFSIFVRIIYYF